VEWNKRIEASILDLAVGMPSFACPSTKQGCQMVYLQTKNTNFWNIFEGLGMKNCGIHMMWPFGIFYSS
jgi:hypothetical protein